MEKKKIEVVELSLGIDVGQNIDPFSKDTQGRINKLIEQSQKEKEILKATSIQEDSLRRCYDALLQTVDNHTPISGSKLIEISEKDVKLASLILKLRQYTIERGNVWTIMKHKIDGVTSYSMRPR